MSGILPLAATVIASCLLQNASGNRLTSSGHAFPERTAG